MPGEIGSVTWRDLTVEDAPGIRSFYEAVVGWTSSEHPMENYSDYEMRLPLNGECVAGICHARGENSNIPAAWLMYITVADVALSVAKCVELGGTVVDGPRAMGENQFAVIRDPAGAVCALFGG